MSKGVFVISYEGFPLVALLLGQRYLLPTEILDRYAKSYAFDRKKLTGVWIDTITKEEFELVTGGK